MSIRPSDALRLRARKIDKAIDIAELIVASGQLPAHQGRTYDDCTVPCGTKLEKYLAYRAVPPMRQSYSCKRKGGTIGSDLTIRPMQAWMHSILPAPCGAQLCGAGGS